MSISRGGFASSTGRQLVQSAVIYIRGYHAYSSVWSPRVGETLTLLNEADNPHDCYDEGQCCCRARTEEAEQDNFLLSHEIELPFCEVTGRRMNRGGGFGQEVYKFY